VAGQSPAERGLRHVWLDAVLFIPPKNDAGIDAHAVAVACALYSSMNANALAWPSLRTIADRAKVKQDTVEDRLKRLEGAGLLRIGRQHRRTNRYQGRIPSWLAAEMSAARATRRRDSIPPLTETAPWDGADETAPWQHQTAPPQPRTAPPEHSNCPTSPANCPTGWGPTGEPAKPGEPVNPARSGGAPPGAPALGGQPIGPEDVAALHQRVEAIFDRLDEHDNNAGIWGNNERDLDPPEDATTCSAFEKRLTAHGYYRINEINERDSRDDLATAEIYDIANTCYSFEAWFQGGSPPWWLQKTLRRQERFVNPAAGLEAIEALKASRREQIIDNAAADARARHQALATPSTEAR